MAMTRQFRWFRRPALAGCVLAIAAGACADRIPGPDLNVANVHVVPSSAVIFVDTGAAARVQLRARGLTMTGDTIDQVPVTWASTMPGVAFVDASGLVRAVSPGIAEVTATGSAEQGRATIVVQAGSAAPGLVVSDPAGPRNSAYAALSLNTAPGATRAFVRRVGDAEGFSVPVFGGGFDPIETSGEAGDSIEVVARDASGIVVFAARVPVRPSRPPVIIRTQPPPDRNDVPVNAAIIVVFSEPMDESSIKPSSVRLLSGNTQVAGTLRFVDQYSMVVEFVPDAPLDPGTAYRLVVTEQVRDLGGEPLASPISQPFVTGGGSAGPEASVRVSPDTIGNLIIGFTYGLTATVRDAAGNTLTGRSVNWTSSNSTIVTVTNNDSAGYLQGRLRGIAPGTATITASSGGITGTAVVTVRLEPPNGVAAVVLTPPQLTIPAGDGATLVVVPRNFLGKNMVDDHGDFLEPVPAGRFVIHWQTTNPAVVRIQRDSTTSSECGFGSGGWIVCRDWNRFGVTGLAQGTAMVIAATEGVSDTTLVTVGPPRSVASVELKPGFTRQLAHDSQIVVAILRDSAGNELLPASGGARTIAWSLSDSSKAVIDTAGSGVRAFWYLDRQTAVVRSTGAGLVHVIASSEGVSETTSVFVPPVLNLQSIAAADAQDYSSYWSEGHTCALTTQGEAYCWGSNINGELGDGTLDADPLPVLHDVPAPVAGGLRFQSIDAGSAHTCALSAAGRAYCWGSGYYLGDGLGDLRTSPVEVSGSLDFVALSTGYEHSCALTSVGAMYCWGRNFYGELGDGTTAHRAVPTRVAGNHVFASVTAGFYHTCGVTSGGQAYCWGNNQFGAIGDGSTTNRSVPTLVDGGRQFSQIAAGLYLTCGLSPAGAAYCWGYNTDGAIGDNTYTHRPLPTAVAGGRIFTAITAGLGAATNCAIDQSGAAWCWGYNAEGQIGDGTRNGRPAPVAVHGGLSFRSIDAGGHHTCAMTVSSLAYCWGRNSIGQLGTRIFPSLVPQKVMSQP